MLRRDQKPANVSVCEGSRWRHPHLTGLFLERCEFLYGVLEVRLQQISCPYLSKLCFVHETHLCELLSLWQLGVNFLGEVLLGLEGPLLSHDCGSEVSAECCFLWDAVVLVLVLQCRGVGGWRFIVGLFGSWRFVEAGHQSTQQLPACSSDFDVGPDFCNAKTHKLEHGDHLTERSRPKFWYFT